MVPALLLAAVASNAAVAYTTPASLSVQVASGDARREMLDDLNAARSAAGLAPLVLDRRLSNAASAHAGDMVLHKYFDHRSPDGRSPFDRMRADGCRFAYAGENIAQAESAGDALSALLRSPGHRQNILNPHFSHVGIGVRAAPGGALMFVQDFSD